MASLQSVYMEEIGPVLPYKGVLRKNIYINKTYTKHTLIYVKIVLYCLHPVDPSHSQSGFKPI